MKATDIMHPEDAKAIQMIKSVPGYEKLVRLFMKLGYEMQIGRASCRERV